MSALPKKTYAKKNVLQALGVAIVLFSVLCLLSAGTSHLWGLSAAIAYLFGIEGLYVIVPFFMFSGFVLAIRGDWKKPDISGRVGYGFSLAALGLGMLWSHFGLAGAERSDDFSIFRNAYEAYSGNRVGFYTANDLGGGVIGYFFAGVFVKPGLWLLCLISSVLQAAGLIIIFLPCLKKLFLFLKGRSALRKSRRIAAKERREFERQYGPEAARPLLGAPSSEGCENPLSPLQLSAPRESSEPAPVPSRVERNSFAAIKNPLPIDTTSPDLVKPRSAVPPNRLSRSGLQEALFIPDGTLGSSSGATAASSSVLASVDAPVFQPQAAEAAPETPASSPLAATPAPKRAAPVFANEVTLGESPDSEPIPLGATAPANDEDLSVSVPASDDVGSPVGGEAPSVSEAVSANGSLTAMESTSLPSEAQGKPAPKPKPSNPAGQKDAVALPDYAFPPLSLLLDPVDDGNAGEVAAECEQTKATIDHCFSDFRVGAHVDNYTVGPSVTRYNIMCDPNVSVTVIGRYIDDISQRLNGAPARFQEVVRGQNTSGLEIPNRVTTKVTLKEMIAALPNGEDDNLMIPFGKTISGECLHADLSNFPHMLVAGSTGSGKSIFMHGVIMSLIMRNRPEDLKLVLVDPKRVEMSNYADIPHLLCPIIKESAQAKVCLDKLIKEMDRRYALFEWSRTRDIRQFNRDFAPTHALSKLPFIIVVVDEFADLVDTCKDVSESVVRLAQKARAAGIHLIISTQRPSVDVITGVIKANLACRVALRVSQANDSMTILGQGGAEDLAGYGDMLVDCETAFRGGFVRAQGAYVDTEELDRVCAYIKSQEAAVYDPEFLDLADHEAEERAAKESVSAPSRQEIKASDDEEYYQQLKEQVMTRQYTSISRIQRENGLGFPRAGRLFARLVKDGVVAAEPDVPGSSKGCRVLMRIDPNNGKNVDGSTDGVSFPHDGHLGEGQ
ncbi:MAG: hypothetical protein LKG11_03025 [Bacilli bacterium]|jgi:DNA segregation ATPase FtsK/SpoIIIE-like protein|nr:hypothetical protein [Bacilli bacterium]